MAIRQGDWRLVRYVAKMDASEQHVFTVAEPERIAVILEAWRAWNTRMKILPWS